MTPRTRSSCASATYTVSVHEATTGNELGTTELSGTDDSCPMFMTFDNATQSMVYDAPPSKDDLVAFHQTVRGAVVLNSRIRQGSAKTSAAIFS
jgi:hypothetical protein